LGRYVDWVRLLTLLDDPPAVAVLPYHTRCPGCQGNMTVMYDVFYKAPWFACDGCGQFGGLIELASYAWQIDLEAAIQKLIGLNVLNPKGNLVKMTQQYVEHFTGKHRRHRRFWEESRARLSVDNSIMLRGLQQKLGLRLHLDRERWFNGPGQFLGGSPRKTIELCFQPGLRDDTWRLSGDRVFIGSNWDEVLLTPSWDMPGRVKGYYFVGREARVPADTVFKNVRRVDDDVDAGLFMMPAARRRPEYDDTVLVVPDPLLALRLHGWHFQDNTDTLPLVACWDDKKFHTSPAIWGVLPPGPFVFWGPPENAANTLKHARAANGSVSELEWPKDSEWKRRTPAEWLHAARRSVPWQVALERALISLPSNKGEELALLAKVTTEEFSRILSVAPADVRDRYYRPTTEWRVIWDGKLEIVETDKGWFADGKTKELISEAVLRIEQVVHHPKQRTIYYSGYVLYCGHKISFYEPATTVQQDTGAWMQELVVKAGHGFPVVRQRYAPNLFEWAIRFHPPQSVKGYNHLGWDEDHGQGCFVFPGYLIKSGGKVVDEPSTLLIAPDGHAPVCAGKPDGLSHDDVRLLSENNPTVVMLWGAAACVITSLLGQVLNELPRGHAVCGPGANTVLSACKLLGCVGHDDLNNPLPRGWPAVVYQQHASPTRDYHFNSWLESPVPPNAFAVVNWHTAQVLRCREGWNVFQVEEYVGSVRDVLTVAPRVVPNVLLYLAKRQFRITPARNGFAAVSAELRNWFAGLGGDVAALNGGLRMVDDYVEEREHERVLDAFFAILCSLYDEGYLVVVREGFDKKNRKQQAVKLVIRNKGELFIPKAGINNGLRRKSAPAWDAGIISRALAAGGVLLAEGELDGESGWFVDDDYWTAKMLAWQKQRPRSSAI
jgi:hypothetical protein